MNKSFWKNKKVFITGDTGFKGSWLVLMLSQAGAKIQGFSSSEFNRNIKFYDSLNLEKFSSTIDGDIRNKQLLEDALLRFKPDVIFHMAAQPLVRESYIDPLTTYDVNVMGTMNVLEAIRKCDSVKSAVMITTDKCYENNEWCWGYKENDALGGHDPYSSSKACSEILIKSYQKSFFNDLDKSPGLSSVRAGNVIGGGDFSQDRLVPDIYKSISTNKKVFLRNPLSTRPWQHVLDPISGYLTVAEQLYNNGSVSNDSWNFGPYISDIRTVKEVAELFCDTWDIKNMIDYNHDDKQPHEATSLSLDISKACFELQWKPRWNLEESISKTVCWYKSYFKKENVLEISIQQIDEFFSI